MAESEYLYVKEIAKKLNGCEYREEVSKETREFCKKNNIVIVYGASDDLMEVDGAIYDEFGAWEGTIKYLDKDGFIENKCDNDDCPYFKEKLANAEFYIKALWHDNGEYAWTYETNIPHAVFDVMEDDEKYCKGIVFSLDELK